MDNLAGKVAVITGASSGIGRSYARALSKVGTKLVLIGRTESKLNEVSAALPAPSIVVAGDVAETGLAETAIQQAIDVFGTVDIVLSNAGLYLGGNFAESSIEDVKDVISVNVLGAFAMVRAALPHMISSAKGDIIMTSSVAGHQSIHWEPVYSATKHSVQAFTHGVRRQLVGTGVRIGEIAPGVVLNELWGFSEGDEKLAEQITSATGITSEDVADALLFMLSRPRHVNIRDLVILPTSQEI